MSTEAHGRNLQVKCGVLTTTNATEQRRMWDESGMRDDARRHGPPSPAAHCGVMDAVRACVACRRRNRGDTHDRTARTVKAVPALSMRVCVSRQESLWRGRPLGGHDRDEPLVRGQARSQSRRRDGPYGPAGDLQPPSTRPPPRGSPWSSRSPPTHADASAPPTRVEDVSTALTWRPAVGDQQRRRPHRALAHPLANRRLPHRAHAASAPTLDRQLGNQVRVRFWRPVACP